MTIRDDSISILSTAQALQTTIRPDGSRVVCTEPVVHEHYMELFLNEQPAAKLVCTPTHLPELVLGRLCTEGIIHHIDEIDTLYICSKGARARVFLTQPVSDFGYRPHLLP